MHVATITIDHTKVAGDLTDYVVAITPNSDAAWATLYATALEGGGDIRIFKAGGSVEIPRELVTFSVSAETGEIHAKFSGTLSGSVDTDIEIHADGSSADYAVGATYGRNAVWSSFGLVFHGNNATDSTGNNTYTETGSPTYSSGKLGSALNGDSSKYLRSGSSPTGIPTGKPNFSTMSWQNFTTKGGYRTSLTFGVDATPYGRGYFAAISGGDPDHFATFWAGGVGYGDIFPTTPTISAGSWYYTATTYDQSTHRLYVDAALIGSKAYTTSNITNSYVNINKHPNTTTNGVHGQLDEIRIANFTASTDWLTTEYNNQNAPTTFYSVAAEGGAPVQNSAFLMFM